MLSSLASLFGDRGQFGSLIVGASVGCVFGYFLGQKAAAAAPPLPPPSSAAPSSGKRSRPSPPDDESLDEFEGNYKMVCKASSFNFTVLAFGDVNFSF